MSEFNERNWKDALFSLYVRSMQDPEYRSLCLRDPITAIKEVSDIDIPPGLKLQFFGTPEEYLYTLLLPPAADAGTSSEDITKQLLQWSTYCTDVTTHGP